MIKKLLEHKRLIIIGSIAIVVLSALGYGAMLYMQAPTVETVEVQEGRLTDYISETGLIEARNTSRILAQVNGQIENIAVSVGNFVKKGDLLLEVSSAQVDLQIKALEAQLRRVRASYNDLINPASETLQSAELRVATLESQLALVLDQYQKSLQLYDEGAISEDALNTTEYNYTIAKNELTIAQNELQLLQRGGSENLRQQYLSQIEEINYNIEQLYSTRGNYQVHAPIEGTVTAMMVNEGDTIIASMEILKVADLSELYISSDILASKAQFITEGAVAGVMDMEDGSTIDSLSVTKVYPTAHLKISDLGIEQKRVRIEIDLPHSLSLRAGYEVDIEVVIREKDEAIFVPEEAVYTINGQDYVLIIDGWRAKELPVETGWKTVDDVEIVSGLAVGQEVIFAPPENLRDGGIVKKN